MKTCRICNEEKSMEEFQIKNKKTGNRRTECKSCRQSLHRQWVENNSESVRRYQAEYKKTRRQEDEGFAEYGREINRAWRSRNIDYDRERQRKYRQENPERFAYHAAKRRALAKNAEGSFSLDEWLTLCAQADGKCLSCKQVKPLTIDHVVPLSKGGSNYIDNIQPLCGSCNSKKGANEKDYRCLE